MTAGRHPGTVLILAREAYASHLRTREIVREGTRQKARESALRAAGDAWTTLVGLNVTPPRLRVSYPAPSTVPAETWPSIGFDLEGYTFRLHRGSRLEPGAGHHFDIFVPLLGPSHPWRCVPRLVDLGEALADLEAVRSTNAVPSTNTSWPSVTTAPVPLAPGLKTLARIETPLLNKT